MKKLISLFMIFMTFSCGDECEPIKDNRDDGSIKLNLVNPDSIRLWCRSVCSFDAVSEGNYSIESQDTSVMKASVQGNHFTVLIEWAKKSSYEKLSKVEKYRKMLCDKTIKKICKELAIDESDFDIHEVVDKIVI